jgi:hypothetical protein
MVFFILIPRAYAGLTDMRSGNLTRSLAVLLLSAPWLVATELEKGPVFVTASFIDKNSLFIEDLSQNEIQILEDGQSRKVELMAKDQLPVAYSLLFDRALFGESWEHERMSNPRGPTSARDIAYELIDKYLGRQAISVGIYDKKLDVALDFTVDGFTAKNAIQRLHGPNRRTESFLYGALLSAVQKMDERSERRRILIVFLDVVDPETAGKIKPLKNLFASSNVELLIVSFASKLAGSRQPLPPQLNQAVLQELARETAGEALFAADHREHLDDISRRLYNRIRTLYTFGFESESQPGKSSVLAIKCTRPGSKVYHHPALLRLP